MLRRHSNERHTNARGAAGERYDGPGASGGGGGRNAGTLAVLHRCRLVQSKDIKRFHERADSVLEAVTEATDKLTEIARKIEKDAGATAEEEGEEEQQGNTNGGGATSTSANGNTMTTLLKEQDVESFTESVHKIVVLKRKLNRFRGAVDCLTRGYSGLAEGDVSGTDFTVRLGEYERVMPGVSDQEVARAQDPFVDMKAKKTLERKIRVRTVCHHPIISCTAYIIATPICAKRASKNAMLEAPTKLSSVDVVNTHALVPNL